MTPDRMAQIHAAAFTPHGEVWSAGEIAAMLDRAHIHAVTLGTDGFALLQIIAPEAELLTIAIHPDAQGKGRGTALLAAAMQVAQDAGARHVFLEVAADNAAAVALYRGAQFIPTGRRQGYYRRAPGVTIDAITLSRDLGA